MADFNWRGRGGMAQRDTKGSNKIEFRFLIPSKAASIIIGKGGERIQRLRHECNARLSIPDNHGPERVFILESTMDNCIKVWRDLSSELKDFMFPPNVESRRVGPSREDSPDMDLRFLVHDSQVGAIIGKGGSNVKNLRVQFQLNVIKVFPVTLPLSSDRVVQIVGKFEQVFDCFRNIYETLEGQTIKGAVENYNSANYDENLTSGYGGWGMDNMRNTDRNAQNNRFNNRPNESFPPKPDMNRSNNFPKPFNRFDSFNNTNDAPTYPESNETDNYQSPFAPARKRNMDMQNDSDNKRGRMGHSNTSNPFEPRNMDKPPNPFEGRNDKSFYHDNNVKSNRYDGAGFNNNSVEKIDVSIPTTLINMVNGFHERVLANIINDSGADIVVAENDEDESDTILSLTGTKDQIDGAQYLLQICIKRSVLNL